MLDVSDVRAYYRNEPLEVPCVWNLRRKHFRVLLLNGRFLKLNKFRNRIGLKDLCSLSAKYAPIHVYFSVLNWLFPERVGKKYKANRAVPLSGEYVCDVDSHNILIPHNHNRSRPICSQCLLNSKLLTMHICEAIEENYSKIQIVFSGRRGFHAHVLDFNLRDWTYYNERDPIKSHEVARFKYSKMLAGRCDGFNRAHFILASDPMRIVSVPYSLNAATGLACIPIGDRKALERLTIDSLIKNASLLSFNLETKTALDLLQTHPEPSEPTQISWCRGGR